MKHIQLVIVLLCISVSIYSASSPLTMEVSVNHKKLTLSCRVRDRNSKLNIYLACPYYSTNCKENCKRECSANALTSECKADNLIQCNDRGFDNKTGLYVIDYVIDASDPRNNGQWSCIYAVHASSAFKVDVPILITSTTRKPIQINMTKSTLKNKDEKPIGELGPHKSTSDDTFSQEHWKLLTKSEFILTIIGLLAVSLIFNIFFCSRIVFIKCKLKKTSNANGDYYSMKQNQRTFNRSNSQASDPERIYEDTSTSQRQMSFLTKIKNANGNYIAQSTLSPSSNISTLLPPNYLPLSHSMSFPAPPNDNMNHLLNTPTQIYYPLPADPNQTNYGALGIHPDTQYTNFLPVQTEMNHRDANNQPVYLAFTTGHPYLASNNRYLQYSNQPSHMATESSNSSTTKQSPVPSQMKNGLVSRSNSEQDNYQLSREMMEEADNLLRTADNLLKSTQKDVEMIQS